MCDYELYLLITMTILPESSIVTRMSSNLINSVSMITEINV